MDQKEVIYNMIGLITFHWADDYGGMLQAYALKSYLSKHENVKIVPYFPKRLRSRYTLIKTDSPYNFKMSLESMLRVKDFSLRAKRRFKMISFRKRYLTDEGSFSDARLIPTYNKSISKYVVGSDQIWNPEITEGLDDGYFCTFKGEASGQIKCIAYAASIGSERLDSEYDVPLRERLENFDTVSVREGNIAPYISDLYVREVYTVLDPVFLRDKTEWEALLNKKPNCKPYILVHYTERNMDLIDYAKALAEKKGLEIRLFRQEYPEYWSDSVHFMSGSGPLEFLSYIRDAQYVITNSFHALAFSLIFQRQLAAFAHSDKNARLNMLLSTAGLTNRIVDNPDTFDIDSKIDWDSTQRSLSAQIEYSKRFIDKEILQA